MAVSKLVRLTNWLNKLVKATFAAYFGADAVFFAVGGVTVLALDDVGRWAFLGSSCGGREIATISLLYDSPGLMFPGLVI